MLIVLAVVALAVVGGGAFMMTSSDDEGESQDEAAGSTTTVVEDGEPSESSGEEDAEGESDGGSATPSPVAGEDDPEAVAQVYIDALLEGDCETMVGLHSENMNVGMDHEMALEECEETYATQDSDSQVAGGFKSLEVRNSDVEDDVATVIADGEVEGFDGPLLVTITLVREGDTWFVDNFA